MKEIIAKRYAKALIQIGREDGQYERYAEELKSFGEVLEASSELRAVMENPIYDKDQKKAIFRALNKQLALSPIIINFILFIIDKRRVGYFDEIIRSYDRLADELAGRARARVTSAVALPDKSLRAIREKLKDMTGKEVIVSTEIDPSLIGGVITQVGDMVYDGSIRTQLESIKETLMKG